MMRKYGLAPSELCTEERRKRFQINLMVEVNGGPVYLQWFEDRFPPVGEEFCVFYALDEALFRPDADYEMIEHSQWCDAEIRFFLNSPLEPVEGARLKPAPEMQDTQAWLAEFEAAKAEFAERVQACLPSARLSDPLLTVGDISDTAFSITVNRPAGATPLLFIHPDRPPNVIETGLKSSDFKGLHLSGDEAWRLAKIIVLNLAGHGCQEKMRERLERLAKEVRG